MIIRFSHRDGLTQQPINANSVVLSDPEKTYGLKDLTTNTIVLPYNTTIPNVSLGHYEITVASVPYHDYAYRIEWTYGGEVQYTPVINVLATEGEVGTTIYASISEINQILSTILHAQAWDEASTSDRAKAIIMSTQAFEILNFVGFKTSCDQPLQFPRNGSIVIPDLIKRALALNVLSLLSGVEPDREIEKIGVTSRRFSSVGTTYDAKRAPMYFLNGIASPATWGILQGFLGDSTGIKMRRIS